VAIDATGRMAAGASTNGMTHKACALRGRWCGHAAPLGAH